MILHEIGRHKAQGPKANAKEHTPNGQAHPFMGKDTAPKTDIAAQGSNEKANIGGIVPSMPLSKGLAPRIVFCLWEANTKVGSSFLARRKSAK